ncbi:hypothetical protein D3C85_1684570 [compost metagenome]
MKLDDGVYQLTLNAPDNSQLQWILRTQLDDGPLALLKLRGFTLPTQIFLMNGAQSAWTWDATNADEGRP